MAYIGKMGGSCWIGVFAVCAGMSGADFLDSARTKLQAGEYSEAETALHQALKSQPGSVDAHLMLALVESKLGHSDAAIREYRTAIRLAPQSFAAHYNLALFLLSQGQVTVALPELQRAGALQPGNSDVLFNLGAVLIEAGRAEEALSPLLRARRVQPDRADILFQLARAYAGLHRYDEADESARGFLSAAHRDDQALVALGEVWLQAGRYDAALQLAEEVTTPSARFLHARALYYLGRLHEAAREGELAVSAEPANAAVLLFAARLRQRAGKWDSAAELLDRAVPRGSGLVRAALQPGNRIVCVLTAV